MRDREDDAAFEQREPKRRERRIDRDLVAAVAVEQERRRRTRAQLAVGVDVERSARATTETGIRTPSLAVTHSRPVTYCVAS